VKTRLMHVRANVRDLSKAIDWYRDVLGFELDSTWPGEAPVYADFNAGAGAVFAIAVAAVVPAGARFNFAAEDVDALWNQLKDRVEIVEALYDTPYGTRKFTIRDLDGNELGFSRG
jgi:catechol 2,3-dioxygenase-like lactoylglutathione lyase family enzyme